MFVCLSYLHVDFDRGSTNSLMSTPCRRSPYIPFLTLGVRTVKKERLRQLFGRTQKRKSLGYAREPDARVRTQKDLENSRLRSKRQKTIERTSETSGNLLEVYQWGITYIRHTFIISHVNCSAAKKFEFIFSVYV